MHNACPCLVGTLQQSSKIFHKSVIIVEDGARPHVAKEEISLYINVVLIKILRNFPQVYDWLTDS